MAPLDHVLGCTDTINDDFAAEMAAAERRKISATLSGSFLRRKGLVLLNH